MAHEPNETEWQFDAVDLRPVVRWLEEPSGWRGAPHMRVVAVGAVSQVDLYLDTDDQRLHRAGYALRIRRVGVAGPKRRLRGFRRRPTTTDCVVAGRSRSSSSNRIS